jgi:predicted NBD/HSP70 family sugar kinase
MSKADVNHSPPNAAVQQKMRRPGPPSRRAEAERRSLATVLNIVRARGPLTRHDVEHLSGLRRATVTERLEALNRLGLVRAGDLARPTGGRAPRLVEFRADAGLVLVAVIDAGRLGTAVADLAGRLLIEHHEAFDTTAAPADVARRLAALFDWLLQQHQQGRRVWGIGLAVGGPIESGADAHAVSGQARPFPTGNDILVAELERHHHVPVSVRNSVQMQALGEFRAGSGIGAQNLIFVDLAHEIAAGLISEGQLHGGADGAAGMIGHIPVANGGTATAICRCGNTGCLEAVAGALAIEREAAEAAGDGRSPILAEVLATTGEIAIADIGLASQRGDAFSAELLSRCGRHIGSVLAALTNALNPSLLILGGEIAETGDILLAAVREAVYRHSHPLVTRDLRIIRSQMGASAGLVGSALALIDDVFSTDFLVKWIALGAPVSSPDETGPYSRFRSALSQVQTTSGENQSGKMRRAANTALGGGERQATMARKARRLEP